MSDARRKCEAGKFADKKGTGDCPAADEGHYVEESGADAQTKCAPGSFASNAGAPPDRAAACSSRTARNVSCIVARTQSSPLMPALGESGAIGAPPGASPAAAHKRAEPKELALLAYVLRLLERKQERKRASNLLEGSNPRVEPLAAAA